MTVTGKKHNRMRSQRGLGLVETLIAVAILGVSVVSFVTALSAGSLAAGKQDEEMVAQNLAQSQLEYVKSYTYDPGAVSYPLLAAPDGYAISVNVTAIPSTDTDIQRVSVTIWRENENILTVDDYKVNR